MNKYKYKATAHSLRMEKQQYIRRYKELHPCSVCGETRVPCLDFHHKDPKAKKFDFDKATQRSYDKIDHEIKKCVVLCANCHRIEHAELLLEKVIETKDSYHLFD